MDHVDETTDTKIPWINSLFITFIKAYQRATKNSAHRCLHYPTCSNYGILALQKYPFLIASKKIICRLLDCHPYTTRPYHDFP